MTYTDLGVLQTDQTALYLIRAVAAPVAQDLVNGAVLTFFEANITYVSFPWLVVRSLTAASA